MAEKIGKQTSLFLGRIPIPELLALLGAILYLIQAVIFAHIRLPNLDEGSYLYKGYLLATGAYSPFQPYGFWINKMYLSFFIWGWVQMLFAPGLLAPRYFAVFLSVLALLGVWIVSRRMGNRWLASIAVWVLALNPALISKYSTATAQVLIICMVTWVLVLSLAAERPVWQIVASAILAALMVLTRENMVFIIPPLILYIFWQHGRKKGFFALLAIVIVLVVGHIIYWPEIMNLWERWLPIDSIPFLKQTIQLDAGSLASGSSPDLSIPSRLHSLSLAIRMHFIPFFGSFIVLLVWPKKDSWQTRAHYRAAVFLAVLFFVLLVSHAWASLANNYCVFCFQDYIAFFGNVGLLLIIVSIGAWNKTPSLFPRLAIITLLLVVASAIGYSLFEQIGNRLLKFPIPRLGGGQVLPGWATLWQVLNNKFHIAYPDARAYTPAVAGLVAGILVLIFLLMIYQRHPRRKTMNFTGFCAYGFLLLGVILLPLLAWPYAEPLCRNDVIVSYEKIGTQLAGIAPPGSKIYLDGSRTAVPLLYVRDVVILLPQLNDHYSFRTGGVPDLVLRRGFWNEQIALAWRDSADVFMIEESRISGWQDYLTPDGFEEIPLPSDIFSCSTNAYIYLFKRK